MSENRYGPYGESYPCLGSEAEWLRLESQIDLGKLRKIVGKHFRTHCTSADRLVLGSQNAVYALRLDLASLEGDTEVIARLAFRRLPRDKLESGVATLRFLAEKTSIPVPRVYFWNCDASNPVGMEYMIMEKVKGVSALEVWGGMTSESRYNLVKQCACFLHQLFSLRFDRIGSIYLSAATTGLHPGFEVGPEVKDVWFESSQGSYGSAEYATRGPYSCATEWLASVPSTGLAYIHSEPEDALVSALDEGQPREQDDLQLAEGTLRSIIQLCSLYSGPSAQPELTRAFCLWRPTLWLADIVVLPSTGDITGVIDWDATSVVPLWQGAEMPHWLGESHASLDGNGMEGGEHEQRKLISAFLSEMDERDAACPGLSWRTAWRSGKEYRDFAELRDRPWYEFGANSAAWVNRALEWAKENPGVPFAEDTHILR